MREHQALPMIVFHSYANEDKKLHNRLMQHLSSLEREGLIRHWSTQKIPAGTERSLAIRQALNDATIILLFISPNFLSSRRCYEVEMTYALNRHKRGKACVIPIIVRPCDWQTAPFAVLECLPRMGKAVTEWTNQDAAFHEIADGIRYTLQLRHYSDCFIKNLFQASSQHLISWKNRFFKLFAFIICLEYILHNVWKSIVKNIK